MDFLKSAYVGAMHKLAALEPFERLSASAGGGDAYGFGRWSASLLAVYDTQRMVALDCPWWNVQATRRVEEFLAARPRSRVFEWGAGASTVWLGRRAREVVSVEHDAHWRDAFDEQLSGRDNVSLIHRPLDDGGATYVDAVEEQGGNFDLIVIDGRYRSRCLLRAQNRLATGGLVLFDDSGRARYRPAIEQSELHETVFFGRSYCVPYPDYTSILSTDGRG